MTTIHVAHSPDADDAFMFYALLQGKLDCGALEFVDVKEDIESLNQKALQGAYEVTAVSFHAYPYIADKYLLLTTGACFGDQYGPIVVASKLLKPKQLLKVRMGIPGKMTSAFLALKLYEHHVAGEGKSGVCYSQLPFDQIEEQVAAQKIDAGLLIHEGQLSFADRGLHKVVDLGEWWHKETGLPLPLGGIAVRRDLAPDVLREVGNLIQKSIQYALEHKEEALAYALPFARGMDAERAQKFIDMYVNEMTVDFGRTGFKAIKTFLERGEREGILPQPVNLEGCIFDVKKGRIRGGAQASEETPTSPEEAPEITSPATSEPPPEESTAKMPEVPPGESQD